MMKKLRFSLLPAILLFTLAFSQTVLAVESYVMDDAGLFSYDDAEEILDEINELREETGMDYLVVTTDDTSGRSVQEYADDTYDASGAGTGEEYSGMLYLIDMDNREIYISTSGDMRLYLTDERIDTLLDYAYDEVSDGDYAGSAIAVLEHTGKYIAAGIEKDQHIYDSETGTSEYYYDQKKGFPVIALVFGLIAGLVAALSTFFGVKARYNLTHETYHYPLSEKSTLDLKVSDDRLVNKFVTHRRIPKNPPPSSGGGGSRSGRSTVHRSSSGRSHGGGGRRF